MTVRLLVKQRSEAGGADKGTEVMLEDETITLGRDHECQVVLAQKAVSRAHARISHDGTLHFIEDLGSAYGTRVNAEVLPKGEKRLLRNGDVIAIAQFDITFDRMVDPPKGASPSDSAAMVARKVVKDAMRGLGSGAEHPYFRVMNGPKEGQRIEMQDAQELVVGRDETADIILKDDLVSRRHAKIRRDWSGTHVEDLESRNGIKVNRKRVSRKTMKDRDELEVGNIRLLYIDPTEVREAAVVLPELAEEEGERTEHAPEAEPSADPNPSEANLAGEGEEGDPGAEPGEAPDSESLAEGDENPEGSEAAGDSELGESLSSTGLAARLPLLKEHGKWIPLLAMGIFALLALVLIIAVLVGA